MKFISKIIPSFKRAMAQYENLDLEVAVVVLDQEVALHQVHLTDLTAAAVEAMMEIGLLLG